MQRIHSIGRFNHAPDSIYCGSKTGTAIAQRYRATLFERFSEVPQPFCQSGTEPSAWRPACKFADDGRGFQNIYTFIWNFLHICLDVAKFFVMASQDEVAEVLGEWAWRVPGDLSPILVDVASVLRVREAADLLSRFSEV